MHILIISGVENDVDSLFKQRAVQQNQPAIERILSSLVIIRLPRGNILSPKTLGNTQASYKLRSHP